MAVVAAPGIASAAAGLCQQCWAMSLEVLACSCSKALSKRRALMYSGATGGVSADRLTEAGVSNRQQGEHLICKLGGVDLMDPTQARQPGSKPCA